MSRPLTAVVLAALAGCGPAGDVHLGSGATLTDGVGAPDSDRTDSVDGAVGGPAPEDPALEQGGQAAMPGAEDAGMDDPDLLQDAWESHYCLDPLFVVCGADGVTYACATEAEAAGTTVVSTQACP